MHGGMKNLKRKMTLMIITKTGRKVIDEFKKSQLAIIYSTIFQKQ